MKTGWKEQFDVAKAAHDAAISQGYIAGSRAANLLGTIAARGDLPDYLISLAGEIIAQYEKASTEASVALDGMLSATREAA